MRFPTEDGPRARGIPDRGGALRWTNEPGVHAHMMVGIETHVPKRDLNEVGDCAAHPAGNDEIAGLVVPERESGRADDVVGVRPVPDRGHIAEFELTPEPQADG